MYVHVRLRNLVADVDNEGGDRKAGNLGRGVEVRESGTNHTEERGHNEGGNVYDEPEVTKLAQVESVGRAGQLTRL
jgi:hypothetical protein